MSIETFGEGVDLIVMAADRKAAGLVEEGVVPGAPQHVDVAGLDGGGQGIGAHHLAAGRPRHVHGMAGQHLTAVAVDHRHTSTAGVLLQEDGNGSPVHLGRHRHQLLDPAGAQPLPADVDCICI
jgi:hypothetical protein